MKTPTKAALGLLLAAAVGLGTASCSYGLLSHYGAVATVNGHAISAKDFNAELERAKKHVAGQFGIDFSSGQGKEMLVTLQRNVVQQLVERELLMQEAEKRHLTVKPAEVESKLAEIKRGFPDAAGFETALKQNGITVDELKDQVSKGLVMEKLQAQVSPQLELTPAKIQEFYQKNPGQFTHNESVSASHILIKVDPHSPDHAKEEARAQARVKEVQAKLKAGGDFGALAKQYSEDPGSKDQGGALGFFEKGRMVPEFEHAAFALKPGQISAPVKTQFGYHLIKRGESHPAKVDSLAEATPRIRELLTHEQKEQGFKSYLAELRSKAKVVVKPEYQAPEPKK